MSFFHGCKKLANPPVKREKAQGGCSCPEACPGAAARGGWQKPPFIAPLTVPYFNQQEGTAGAAGAAKSAHPWPGWYSHSLVEAELEAREVLRDLLPRHSFTTAFEFESHHKPECGA